MSNNIEQERLAARQNRQHAEQLHAEAEKFAQVLIAGMRVNTAEFTDSLVAEPTEPTEEEEREQEEFETEFHGLVKSALAKNESLLPSHERLRRQQAREAQARETQAKEARRKKRFGH